MQPSLKKIGDVAALLGTTTRALRFYEEEGLIEPKRTLKNTRLYSADDISRLRVILLLTAADVPIQDIKNLSLARSKSRTGDVASQHISHLLEKMREKINAKKNLYAQLERELSTTDKLVRQCFGCTLKPTRDTCFACTRVPDFRKAFMIKLIAQESTPGSRTKNK